MPSRASILCGLMAGAAVTLPPSVPPLLEAAAIAAPSRDVYTRKRVNGRWITGVFPKSGAVRGRARHLLATRSRGEEPRESHQAAPPPRPARPADASAVTSSIAPAAGEMKIEGMRPALEAHARMLASQPLSDQASRAPTPPNSGSTSPPIPRSVTFDFDKGVKTIVFGDGLVLLEAFDVAEMRDLATIRPPSR